MRLLLLFTLFALLPFQVQAEDLDNQINKACLRHSVSLLAKLKSEVVGEMSQQQSDKALKISNESCQAYFKKEFATNPESVAAEQPQEKKKKSKDSFTDYILGGDTGQKQGNERLKKKR